MADKSHDSRFFVCALLYLNAMWAPFTSLLMRLTILHHATLNVCFCFPSKTSITPVLCAILVWLLKYYKGKGKRGFV